MAQLQYDPQTGKYIDPYAVRMQTLASREAAANSGVQDLSGNTPDSAQKIDWLGNSNLEQNVNVQGLDGSAMEGKNVGMSGGDNSGAAQGAAAAAQGMQAGNNGASSMGAGMTAAGTASANPYLVAAGLALSAAGSAKKASDQRKMNKYSQEMQKYAARQAAIQKMAQIGAGLKA